ncbi:unnamed protein product [Durusdinium trenchii]|uniref:Uncharacterized protein n=1 Tax=Durusdinium trenchii TaxID=1381693 RepID=A0ABP0P5A8_9DINO
MFRASHWADGHGAQPLRTGFLPYDPDKAICAGGGAWYDCRLNKWGDDVVACEKWCGLPPLLPVFWQKTMFTDCGFENAHPEDDGLHPPVLDIFPSAKDVLGNAMKYEPWRGWPFRTKYPMEFNDYGGLPPDNERQITKICCNKPLRKCLTARPVLYRAQRPTASHLSCLSTDVVGTKRTTPQHTAL